MPGLSDTIRRLSRQGRSEADADRGSAPGRLRDLGTFGTNPGALDARFYLPDNLAPAAPLVVILHGCTQTAADYDIGSGWSQMADRHGFALLFAEQRRQNNPNRCFNWFVPGDSRRGAGEPLSIRQMISTMVDRFDLDPARVFVTGLSAGGAMTSVMLATYPEVFAGGAIIAGLPFGSASTVPQAFERMRGHGGPDGAALIALVRNAAGHSGPWPIVSIWHGSGDATVSPGNAALIAGQWRGVHGLAAQPHRTETVDGYPRRVWHDASGRAVIEEFSITGMGHGTPLDSGGENGIGRIGSFMLDARISSTRHICRFWGLTDADEHRAARPPRLPEPQPTDAKPAQACFAEQPRPAPDRPGGSVQEIIENALRSAGLMR